MNAIFPGIVGACTNVCVGDIGQQARLMSA
jgi:hypothetical protein